MFGTSVNKLISKQQSVKYAFKISTNNNDIHKNQK